MFSYEFPIPYPEMVLYTVFCIICLCLGGIIIKKYLRSVICPHLIPLLLVILSFVVSNLYTNGFEALFTLNINDIRAITNGLAAVGLHQLISKTYLHIKYRKIQKDGKYRGKKIS